MRVPMAKNKSTSPPTRIKKMKRLKMSHKKKKTSKLKSLLKKRLRLELGYSEFR